VSEPNGWAETPMGNLLTAIEAGRSFKCSEHPAEPHEWGVIKVSAMTWKEFDEAENKAVLSDHHVDPRFEIRSGDLLFSRANTVTYVGAVVQVGETRPRLLLSDKSLRLVPCRDVLPRWLLYYLRSQRARRYLESLATGTSDSMRNISQASLRSLTVPLAPLREQEKIIAAIEEQFSRLDAGLVALKRARISITKLEKAVILATIPEEYPERWKQVTVGEAGEVVLGRQRSPKYHLGPNMRPYLRVANVFEDRIDTSDVMSMHFEDEEFSRFLLRSGDILLNEGQSPHLLGRSAMYRGDPPNVAFTNSLLRFRVRPHVLPSWALLVFRRHLHAKRFMRESQITTNIAHLSAGRFKNVEFPIPPIREQESIVADVEEKLSALSRIANEIDNQLRKATSLRSAILTSAFSGKLI
jgi:type I restriction enzyme, S subunit